MALWSVAALAACLLMLALAAGQGFGLEGPSCEQYDCAPEVDEAPVIPPDSDPAIIPSNSHDAPASASAPASAPASVSASASASAAASADGVSGGSVGPPPGADGDNGGSSYEMDVTADEAARAGTDAAVSAGYPYEGEPCDDRTCGIEDVGEPVECAAYETTGGQRVYGCQDPNFGEGEGCYEITFYTHDGRPYANLDTCSGERAYAPPEPPGGDFQYWDPPEAGDPSPYLPWYGHRADLCMGGEHGNRVDLHCGLTGLPNRYLCETFFGTIYGTVRGCIDEKDVLADPKKGYLCAADEHFYDEAGREIIVLPRCPKISVEECGNDDCGMPVPSGWSCRKESWDFGKLYGGERREMTRCSDPMASAYINHELPSCIRKHARVIGVLFDEQGREVDSITCKIDGGGGAFAEWAGPDADDADDALQHAPAGGDVHGRHGPQIAEEANGDGPDGLAHGGRTMSGNAATPEVMRVISGAFSAFLRPGAMGRFPDANEQAGSSQPGSIEDGAVETSGTLGTKLVGIVDFAIPGTERRGSVSANEVQGEGPTYLPGTRGVASRTAGTGNERGEDVRGVRSVGEPGAALYRPVEGADEVLDRRPRDAATNTAVWTLLALFGIGATGGLVVVSRSRR